MEILSEYANFIQRTMEKVRNTFVLLCNLGQRHSDIRRIAPEHFSRGT